MTGCHRALAFLALVFFAGCRRDPGPPPLQDRTALYDATRELSPEDLARSSLREILLTEATITARAGDVFDERWMQEYFFEQPWYAPGPFDESRLSDLDRRNLDVVRRMIEGMTDDELRAKRDPLEARFVHGQLGLVGHVALSPDATRAVSAHQAGRVSVWSVPDGAEVLRLSERIGWHEYAMFVDFSRDGSRVVGAFTGFDESRGRRFGRVVTWDATDGRRLSEVTVPLQWPTKLALHLESAVAIGAKSDHLVAVWDLGDGSEIASWHVPDDRYVFDMAFAPDGRTAILGTSLWTSRKAGESRVVLLDVTSGEATEVWSDASDVSAVAWSRDGARIGAGYADGTIRIWSVPGRRLLATHAIGVEVQSLRLPGKAGVRATSRSGLFGEVAAGAANAPLRSLDLTALDVSEGGLVLAGEFGNPSSSGLHLLDASGKDIADWQGHREWPGDEERLEYLLLTRALGEALPTDVLDEDDVRDWIARPSGATDPRLLDVALTDADLSGLDACALAAIRLEIRARRGFPRTRFGEPTHLDAPPGYVADPAYEESRLTAMDRQNLETIRAAELEIASPRTASTRRSWMDVAKGLVPGGGRSRPPGDEDWSFYLSHCAY